MRFLDDKIVSETGECVLIRLLRQAFLIFLMLLDPFRANFTLSLLPPQDLEVHLAEMLSVLLSGLQCTLHLF